MPGVKIVGNISRIFTQSQLPFLSESKCLLINGLFPWTFTIEAVLLKKPSGGFAVTAVYPWK